MLAPSLQAMLGGDATPDECATITSPLFLRAATDLRGIEHFINVEAIELLGCAVSDLGAIARLPRLRELRLLCCALQDIGPLRAAAHLRDLEVNFCLVEDISPLLDMPELHWIKLFANPLTDDSFLRVLPQLAAERTPFAATPLVEASPESEWLLSRQIRAAGLPIAFGSIPRFGACNIVRPGPGTEGRVVDFLEVGLDFVENTVGKDPAWRDHAMWTKFFSQPWVDQSLSRFRLQWLAGNHRDAYDWITSSDVPEVERQPLFRFVRRFSRERFFLDTAEYMSTMKEVHRVDVPAWWNQTRHRVLAGVRAEDRTVGYVLGSFERESITRSSGTYRLGWLGYYNDEDRRMYLDRCGVFPIGDITAGGAPGSSLLAINVRNPGDRQIYELWPRSLYHAVEEGRSPRELIRPVFSSFASLLGSVDALVTTTGRIQAAPD